MNIEELKAPAEDCPYCNGTGEADSGGDHPWGAPATIPCRCMYEDPFHVHVSAYNNVAGQLEDAQSEIRALLVNEQNLREELIALKKAISEAEPVAIMWRGRDKGPWRFCNALGNWPLDPAVFTETEADPLYTLKGIK